ncbi:SpoIIE family protein phosphatase, partial [Kitasatospora sp. NPDC059571]|uniref:SpoIIE family protein phosphatase n=1 Tax=Kitasatospora sp. NPDC059571 TaxID=3346871 RepID=UPI003681E271
MDAIGAGADPDRDQRPSGIDEEDLPALLHSAVRKAVDCADAVAAVVYLLTADGNDLRAAVIGGSPPPIFAIPGRMSLEADYASAAAVRTGAVTVLARGRPTDPAVEGVPAYPYTITAVPLNGDGHRFGALAVVRSEEDTPFDGADLARLVGFADRLGQALAGLLRRRIAVDPGPLPLIVPVYRDRPADPREHGWGVPGAPGSTGTSMMYPVRWLADLLNRATGMDDIMAAARCCLVEPFRARTMVLACADEGRLWVVGHYGASSVLVRELHGSRLHTRTPAALAVTGHLVVVRPEPTASTTPTGEDTARAGPRAAADDLEHGTEAYLPLSGDRRLKMALDGTEEIRGVCCLAFAGDRYFSPDERAVLGMMAGTLGAAVRRLELGARRQALAERLQKSLLPRVLEEFPRLDVTARYLPAAAGEVGGDWYDLIPVSGARVVLAVGDVEGHTIDGAAVMGQVRTAVAAYATEGHRPAVIIDRTRTLLAELGTELLVTCCLVALDTADGTAEVALAGHPAPLLLGTDGSLVPLDAPANVPLGVADQGSFASREHTLEPGSVLILYSNGLGPLESADAGFRTSTGAEGPGTSSADLEQLADRLLADAGSGAERRDDAVVLLARYNGTADGQVHTGRMSIQRHDLGGVQDARRFVDRLLTSWDLAALSDDAQLLVSEVVTNALIHAGSDVDLRMRAFSDHVRMEVRDFASQPPVPYPFAASDEGAAEAEHGRGLFLVEALTRAWNSSPNGRGKTVWLEMAVPRGGTSTPRGAGAPRGGGPGGARRPHRPTRPATRVVGGA